MSTSDTASVMLKTLELQYAYYILSLKLQARLFDIIETNQAKDLSEDALTGDKNFPPQIHELLEQLEEVGRELKSHMDVLGERLRLMQEFKERTN